MTGFDLFLGSERPEVDFPAADNDVVGHLVVVERGQDGLRSVEESINYILDAHVGPCVPDFDDFVSAETDQVITLFVDVEVRDGGVVAVQVSESAQSEWLPQNDVSLFTAAGHESVFRRVDKCVHSLLMQIECPVLFISQVI